MRDAGIPISSSAFAVERETGSTIAAPRYERASTPLSSRFTEPRGCACR